MLLYEIGFSRLYGLFSRSFPLLLFVQMKFKDQCFIVSYNSVKVVNFD